MLKILLINSMLFLILATSCNKEKYLDGYYTNIFGKIALMKSDTVKYYNPIESIFPLTMQQVNFTTSSSLFSCFFMQGRDVEFTITQFSAARYQLSSIDSCVNASQFVGLYHYVDLKNYEWDSIWIMFRDAPEADQRIFKSDLKKMATPESQGLDAEIKLIITGLCDDYFNRRSSMPNFDLNIFYDGSIIKKASVEHMPYFLTKFRSVAYNKYPYLIE